jgi:hypothetical protein
MWKFPSALFVSKADFPDGFVVVLLVWYVLKYDIAASLPILPE